YLVLLRAGFCLPPMLPPARCALTAPFHPYLFAALKGPRYVRRGDRPPYGATGHATYAGATLSGSPKAVCFLCHFPSGHPDRALPGALPCGVRTFLSSARRVAPRSERSSVSLRQLDSTTSSSLKSEVRLNPPHSCDAATFRRLPICFLRN